MGLPKDSLINNYVWKHPYMHQPEESNCLGCCIVSVVEAPAQRSSLTMEIQLVVIPGGAHMTDHKREYQMSPPTTSVVSHQFVSKLPSLCRAPAGQSALSCRSQGSIASILTPNRQTSLPAPTSVKDIHETLFYRPRYYLIWRKCS